MYALDYNALVKGSENILSATDDVGRMLFESAAGIERLGETLKSLESQAEKLWNPHKAKHRLYYLALDAHKDAQDQVKQALLRAKDWKSKNSELTQAHKALIEAREREDQIRQERNRLERIRRVGPKLRALDDAEAQRQALFANGSIVPLVAENGAQLLRDAQQKMALANSDITRLQLDIVGNQTEQSSQLVDRNILALSAEITDLNEMRLQFRAHETDIIKRRDEINTEWTRVQELANNLGWTVDSELALSQRLPAVQVRQQLERLLKKRNVLAEKLSNVKSQATKSEIQLQQAQHALSELTGQTVNQDLARAVEQAQEFRGNNAVISELQQKIDGLEYRIEASLAGLGAWRQSPDALRSMIAPHIAELQGLIEQNRSDAAAAKSERDALNTNTQEVQRLELELAYLMDKFQPVSYEQVQQARHVRDQSWQEIKSVPQLEPSLVSSFEGFILNADQLADNRLERARYEADRQAQTERLKRQHTEQAHLERSLESIQARIDARNAKWSELALACGLPQMPLECAPAWLQQRQLALDLIDEKAQAQRQQKAKIEAVAATEQTLRSMLGAQSENPPPDLMQCLRRGQAKIKQANEAQGQRRTLKQQISAEESTLANLTASVQSAQTAWNSWESSWHDAVQAAGYSPTVQVEQVESEVNSMQRINELLERIRSIRVDRIDTMQADLDRLAISAQSLAQRAAPQLAQHAPADIALQLTTSLQAAQKADLALTQLQNKQTKNRAELAAAEKNLAAIRSSLAPLMAAAGVEEIESLGYAIEQSDQRRKIESEISSAKWELAQASDNLSIDKLREEVASIEHDQLILRLENLNQQSTDAVEEIETLSNRYGALKSAFDALDGSAAAAVAEAKRQEAIADIGEIVQQYIKLCTTIRLLKWSMEKFRQTQQGPMLAKASAFFKELTLGSFNRLVIDSESNKLALFGVRLNNSKVGIDGLSDGSRDQLYLALRLAALELQIDQGARMPLIADDLFINFDDNRTAAGLRALGEISRKTQVIFLTHHDHLAPLAKEILGDDLNVISL
jgi:uncharacterized protein YhaN